MNMGEKIFNLRKEKGISQQALAELLGTTRQAVSKWEAGRGYPETENKKQNRRNLSKIISIKTIPVRKRPGVVFCHLSSFAFEMKIFLFVI